MSSIPPAFYEPTGDRFVSTDLTRGPWTPDAQHAGPPAALLGRAIERLDGLEGFLVARITLEILRPVPIVPLTVEARLLRPGRSVQLAAASLSAEGVELMRATAWCIRLQAGLLDRAVGEQPPAPPGPESGSRSAFFDGVPEIGYHTGMEVTFIHGGFVELGPAVAWLRMAYPLVTGEEPSPLGRVLVAADSGNGISSTLDARRYLFVNTELTVHLTRYPEGDWIGMDAVTRIEPHGVGLARNKLFDRAGQIGDGHQALFVAPRPAPKR